jgi:hypothetical protein
MLTTGRHYALLPSPMVASTAGNLGFLLMDDVIVACVYIYNICIDGLIDVVLSFLLTESQNARALVRFSWFWVLICTGFDQIMDSKRGNL